MRIHLKHKGVSQPSTLSHTVMKQRDVLTTMNFNKDDSNNSKDELQQGRLRQQQLQQLQQRLLTSVTRCEVTGDALTYIGLGCHVR